MTKFTFIDLFAGIGGFRQALTSLGGRCLGFSEIFRDAITAYCENYHESEQLNFGDITKIKELPTHDFMTAGVPCQSWSIAGKKLGFDDDRGQLWNDTLYLLNQSNPKVFIFENVKGLADPRNAEALQYILQRIREAGYYAEKFILNSYDYGVPQTRVRIYIIGFREKEYFHRFVLPRPQKNKTQLWEILDDASTEREKVKTGRARWSLSCNEKGFNNYFLFNDIRNGKTTIHTWDILDTTDRQKHICELLIRNRRKRDYGCLDGNPLALEHFQALDNSVSEEELSSLVDMGILRKVSYSYRYNASFKAELTEDEQYLLSFAKNGILNVDELKIERSFKVKKISIVDTLDKLESNGIVDCIEERYTFKHSKISTGLFGVNRIFLPGSDIYPTMVASDTNDYITSVEVDGDTIEEYRKNFLEKVYKKKAYRQISKSEACRIQGFPSDFVLPESRSRWMHLIGNSVSVPVIRHLAHAIIKTGVFGYVPDATGIYDTCHHPTHPIQLNLFDSF